MPQVSIIIATFNSGRTVRAALESVYTQTFQDWECIIVDGASKDNTLDIVKEYVAKDSRFRYVSEPDKGIYDAFNKGWKMATGEWVHYLGSDDRLTKEGMEKIAAELDDRFSIVTGDVYLHRADGTVKMQQYNGYFGCHQGVLMQRKIIEKLGGFDEQYHILADSELLIRSFKGQYSIKNVRVFLANFCVGGESQKLSSQWEMMMERYRINKKHKMNRLPLIHSLRIMFRHSVLIFLRKFKS